MGYTTQFNGIVGFDRQIGEGLMVQINQFCDKRHCKSQTAGDKGYNETTDYAPGLWCNWEVSEDRMSLEWDGSEKSYDMEKWLPILIEKFLVPKGIVCNGEVEAQGEEVGDHLMIKVTDNNVEVKHATF